MRKIIITSIFAAFLIQSQAAESAAPAETTVSAEQQNADVGDAFDTFDDEGFGEEYGSDGNATEVYDPLEGYNRFMTRFNNMLFDYVLQPFFKGYDFIVPEPLRVSINNIFNNLYFPVSLVNNLLQLKFEYALSETGRFIINSTFGFAGMFDTAQQIGVEPHVEDFGQTLGHYGVGGGFPIVLPFFGPSNLRDFTGDLFDFYADPIYYVAGRQYNIPDNTYQGWGLVSYKQLNQFSLYEEEYKQLRNEAVDFYPLMRDAYKQSRDKLISE